MSVKVDALSKSYGQNKAVDNITFEIKKGEIVGFLGPNGAGKSTTMKIITGCLSSDKGKVFINNIDTEGNMDNLKKEIGYLPENNPLYLNMYVREYLEYCAGIYLTKNEIKQSVNQSIEAVGLGEHQYKKCGELSKGYRQRVGLARAMAHNPSILILDEPTTGLDPNQIIEIRNLVKQLGNEKTVILSTHIMQEAEAVCNRAIIINRGKIVADNTLDNLKSARKTNQITVEFDKVVDENLLKNINGIIEIKNENNIYTISSNEDIRGEIFDFAVLNQLKILTLNLNKHSLENIFRELTQ
ncbi:MAG: gliding motility-associated ABC transporter ATP-binding subunit GldA [Bacteroidales bacterium]|nr:gliding motility-associated ABC transporter ATP-binding subunit GldA [Bacteroidales bacterium]